jgi:hypothetical protein
MKALVRFLAWRLVPLCAVVWAMKSGSVEYHRYYVVLRHASYYFMAYANLTKYVSSLETYYLRHRALPPDFATYLQGNFTTRAGDASVDPWRTPYQLDERATSFTVTCCGPDRQCGSPDDMSSEGEKVTRTRRQVMSD